MKGQVPTAFMLVIMAVTAMVTISFYLSIPYGAGETRKLAFTQDIYTMENALRAAKLYSRTALRYSTYQACYDTLTDYYDSVIDRKQFKTELEKRISDNFRAYTSEDYTFLEYPVKFPQYTVEVRMEPDTLIVNASAPNLVVESKTAYMKTRLEKSSNITEDIKINCWGLYSDALNVVNSLQKKLNSVSVTATRDLPRSYKGIDIDMRDELFGVRGDRELCEDVFKQNTSKSFEEARETLRAEVNATLNSDEILKNVSAEAKHLRIDVYKADIDFERGGIERPGLWVNNLTCNFTYIVDADFGIDLNSGQQFPVWNGIDITFENLSLYFSTFLSWNSTEAEQNQ